MNLCSGEDLKWRWIFLARDIEVEGHQYSLQNDLQLKKKKKCRTWGLYKYSLASPQLVLEQGVAVGRHVIS